MNVGTNQALSVTFTPTDPSNYNIVAKIVNITVNSGGLVSPVVKTPVVKTPVIKTPAVKTPVKPLDSDYTFKLSLKLGSHTKEVLELQKVLKNQGYFKGRLTGYFGPLTQEAVILFQKANNILLSPGVVGSATRNVLNMISVIPPVTTPVIKTPAVKAPVKTIKIQVKR